MIRYNSVLFALVLVIAGPASMARSAVIGSMAFDLNMNLSFLVDTGAGITDHPPGIDFISPRILYSSAAEGVASHAGPFGGEGLESGSYYFSFQIPNFPLPSTSSQPFGGFFAYYSYTDSLGALAEGAFVGFDPKVTPTGTFDELFASTGVTEEQFLSTLKTPGFDGVLDTMNMFSTMTTSGLMPNWSYNVGLNSWSLDMNVYAFSAPQISGTISGGLVATPTSTVPEPSSLTMCVICAAFSRLVVSFSRRSQVKCV